MVYLSAFAILSILPVILTITNSCMKSQEIYTVYSGIVDSDIIIENIIPAEKTIVKIIPDQFSLEQYIKILFQTSEYLHKFWNAIILVVPIVTLQIIIGALAAYGFTIKRGKLYNILMYIYIVLMLMPYQVLLVPNYIVAEKFNLLNTRASIILPGVFSTFSVFLITKTMRRIPAEILEAAKIDGANDIKIFILICMPLCKNIVYSLIIIIFVDYWNMIEQPLIMLSDVNKQPLSVYLSAINYKELGTAFALSVIFLIPPLLIFMYGAEYLEDGIATYGGVK